MKKEGTRRLIFLLLAFVMMFALVPNIVNAGGIKNTGENFSNDNVYYAKDKAGMLAVYTSDRQLAESWAFCINENKGTPSYDGNGYYVGTYAFKGFDDWALHQEMKKSWPRLSQADTYKVVKALLYMFHEDPFNFSGGLSGNQYWTAVQDVIYYYTQSKELTNFGNNMNNITAALKEKAEAYKNGTLSEADAKLLIPNSKKIEIKTYEATSGGVQSLVTARVTDKARVYFSKFAYREGMTDEEISNMVNNTAEGLAGAKFMILDSDGKALFDLDSNQVMGWTSNENPQPVTLESGEYTLVETEAPAGYMLAEPVKFKIDGSSNADKLISVITQREDVRFVDGDTIAVLDKEKKPEAKKLTIKKVGFDGQALLGGANFSILKSTDKTQVFTFTSNDKFEQTIELVPGSYILTETKAPAGYKNTEDIPFVVTPEGTIAVGQDVNKEMVTTEGSELTVKNRQGPSLRTKAALNRGGEKWITLKDTDELPVTIIDKVYFSEIPQGEYTLVADLVKNYDENYLVDFDKENSGFVGLEITDKVSGSAEVEITIPADKLELGQNTYTVIERLYKTSDMIGTRPNPTAEPVAEHVSYNDQDQTIGVTIEKPIHTFAFWKVDENDQALPGARLQIFDKDDLPVPGMIWNSLDSFTRIYLPAGKYTLKEIKAPEGYTKFSDAKFTVGDDGSITFENADLAKIEKSADNGYFVRVKNTKVPSTEITFSKTEVNGSEELPGASLKVVKGDSKDGTDLVEEWVSAAERKVISLSEGIYTMVETQAPNGYQVAESITFRVTADGKVEIKGADGQFADKTDKIVRMQDAKTESPVQPSLATTVKANKSTGDEAAPASLTAEEAKAGVTVTDTIVYKNLVAGKDYTVTGKLYKVVDGEIVGDPIAVKEVLKRAETADGEWTIAFDKVTSLEANTSYVVFEKAISVENLLEPNGNGEPTKPQEASHEDPKDNSQTVRVEEETPTGDKEVVFSKVDIGGEEIADAKIQVKQGEKIVTEWISAANESKKISLAPGTYTFHEEAAPTGYLKVTDFTFTVAEDGTIALGTIAEGDKVVNQDGKIIVTDKAKPDTPDEPTPDEPSYPNEDGKLKTTIKARNSKSDGTKPASITALEAEHTDGVQVYDFVAYSGLVKDKVYKVRARLFEVESGQTKGEALLIKEVNLKAADTNGQWVIDLGNTKELKPEKSYVVFEKAVSAESLLDTDGDKVPNKPQEAVHEDPTDPSQTVTVEPKPPVPDVPENPVPLTPEDEIDQDLKTKVNINEVTAEEAKEGVNVVDTISYEGLIGGKTYTVTGNLYQIADGGAKGSAVLTKTQEFTADESGKGSWELDLGSTSELQSGVSYVVFEKAVSKEAVLDTNSDDIADKEQVAVHEDPDDPSQTVTVKPEEPTPFVPEEPTPEEPENPENPNGENPKDEKLATTVTVNDKAASKSKAAEVSAKEAKTGVSIVDTISYEGLVGGKTYTVRARLYKVLDGKTAGEAVAERVVTLTAADSGKGSWTVDFGKVMGLEANASYVVFEKAISAEKLIDVDGDTVPDRPQEASHEDPNDPSQTVTVKPENPDPEEPENPEKPNGENPKDGKLATTVIVNGRSASKDKAARVSAKEAKAGLAIVDTIFYEGLVGGKTYTVKAKLYKVLDGKIAGEAVAEEEVTLTADEGGKGSWTVDFGKVMGLEANASYVVFEKAVSTENLIDTDKDGKADKKQEASHEDPTDKSQTITVGPKNSSLNKTRNGKTSEFKKVKTSPKTGDNSNVLTYSLLFVFAGGLLIFAGRKRLANKRYK